MPREDRRIYFEPDEIYKAIYALCVQKQARKPPVGLISKIEEKPSDPSILMFRFEHPHHHTVKTIEYTRDFVAAAIMVFCRACRIPLPKRALKSIEINDNKLILRVLIE